MAAGETTHHTQRGAALLTAMVIVTLVATLAAAMMWQQWRAVQVEAAERGRMQAAWILSGALDWARLILREDARNAGADHLGEPWAVPLAEARLSTFLAVDKDNTDDSPEAFLSGVITDAQSRYNLRNLVDEGKVRTGDLAILQRICELAGVSVNVAERIATGLRDALGAAPDGEGNPPLMPVSVGQLDWLQLDPDSIRRLSPHVVLLPAHTPVNLNTASREVIFAVVEGLDLGSAERLVQIRQRTPFKNLDEVKAQLPPTLVLKDGQVDTRSNFFEVLGRLRLEDRVLQERSLVERRDLDVLALQRERVSLNDPEG